MKMPIERHYASVVAEKTTGFMDVCEVENLEILIGLDNRVCINTEDGCLFRASRVKNLFVKDERQPQAEPPDSEEDESGLEKESS